MGRESLKRRRNVYYATTPNPSIRIELVPETREENSALGEEGKKANSKADTRLQQALAKILNKVIFKEKILDHSSKFDRISGVEEIRLSCLSVYLEKRGS